ncbi:MAG: hypothetical protein HQK87_07005 [Nitrospinae bacterium]|nr:hypothetical protein [Nitrospinota bacterium]
MGNGILSVSRSGRDRMRIEGACHVGRAICSDVILEVHEKVDGALAALLGYAARGAFRVERTASPATAVGDLIALLIRQFLDALSSYASGGREFAYASETAEGAIVGGRLDVPGTIRLRARGLGHKFRFRRNVLTFAVPLNRVLFAALREIRRIAELVEVPPEVIARARGLAMLFGDCLDSATLFGRRSEFARQAQDLMSLPIKEDVRDLLALAGTILSHESFEHGLEHVAVAPRAWFLNLESLFESSVLAVLGNQIGTGGSVFKAGKAAPSVFGKESDEFRVRPDIVIRSASGEVIAVGDVKYKNWTGRASPADIYQLLVHTAAYKGASAFLVFPGERFEVRDMGSSVTGAETRLFAVDVRNLGEGLRNLLTELKLPLRSPAAAVSAG